MGAVPRLRADRGRGRRLSDPSSDFSLRRQKLGAAGERAAADLLRRRGYDIVGAGFLARRGELDLVCRRGGELLVVEVKTRTSDRFGTPLEAVGARKRRAMASAAAEYRALADWRGPVRFAVVAVTSRDGEAFDAELIEDPFG